MEVTSHRDSSDITETRANKNTNQSECIQSQPTANGTLPHPSTGETEISFWWHRLNQRSVSVCDITSGSTSCLNHRTTTGDFLCFCPELRLAGWTSSQAAALTTRQQHRSYLDPEPRRWLIWFHPYPSASLGLCSYMYLHMWIIGFLGLYCWWSKSLKTTLPPFL